MYLSEYVNCLTNNLTLRYIHVTVRRYRFLFNNQTEALIIQIYSVIKLYIPGRKGLED